ncbi:sushi domain-containing protein 1 isoform X2 [Electrophorus electricus]|uniref:Sushi domain containing 1 n=1 Tax=Electrophorus electricus TaxID=8005 RepID=A0A4W4DTM2_ELEEL|nr:sushi domain-containing protein 1 isoform X2 [Electrophorus electricus]
MSEGLATGREEGEEDEAEVVSVRMRDEGNTAVMNSAVSITVFILLTTAIAIMTGVGAEVDVCASCHANATCEDKTDGTGGKVCNCMYGFVGNGRTHCQDKDECQLGRICGDHSTCHNTHGSYYCTCVSGYTPTNHKAVFIPNDGTYCHDVDECEVENICGEGGVCMNKEGDFSCTCQIGYTVQKGFEPFQPLRDKAYCEMVDCGAPPVVQHAVQLSPSNTHYGSTVQFGCADGFVWRNGVNTTVCGPDGRWSGPSLHCEAVNCSEPRLFPHSHHLWSGSSQLGSVVHYVCHVGFYNAGTQSTSVCSALGRWSAIDFRCREIQCGIPLPLPHSVVLWDGHSKIGSRVLYACETGYHSVGEGDISVCNSSGHWTKTHVTCEEIQCGEPSMLPHSGRIWNGNVRFNSTVIYYCMEGYYPAVGKNKSVCSENGSWTKPTLLCREIECGVPPSFPHAVMLWTGLSKIGTEVRHKCDDGFYNAGTEDMSVCNSRGMWSLPRFACQEVDCGTPPPLAHTLLSWDGSSTLGSVARYECEAGYHSRSTQCVSVCSSDNQWSTVHLHCQAYCGPTPLLAHSQVLWENSTVVVHRCIKGYYSRTGSDMSVCDTTGRWQVATLRCREVRFGVRGLAMFNQRCLQWNTEAEHSGAREQYRVSFIGERLFDHSFSDSQRKLFSSAALHPVVCLNLQPATNYTITVTAQSTGDTATVTANTSIPVPSTPEVRYSEVDAHLPMLRLRRAPSTLDPICAYQVIVLPVEGMLVFDCGLSLLTRSSEQGGCRGEYVAAQLELRGLGTDVNFTLGNRQLYGQFYNAPLESGKDYYIILRTVCHWKQMRKQSCVIWAKALGASYASEMSALVTFGSIGVVGVLCIMGYCCSWFWKALIP